MSNFEDTGQGSSTCTTAVSHEETEDNMGASGYDSTSAQDLKPPERDMKKAAAHLIGAYYYLLTTGCGNSKCSNPNCASSGLVPPMSKNEAAVRALQLVSERAALCNGTSAKALPGTDTLLVTSSCTGLGLEPSEVSVPLTGSVPESDSDLEMDASPVASSAHAISDNNLSEKGGEVKPEITGGLTESFLLAVINECINNSCYVQLRVLLWKVFSNEMALKRSFLKQQHTNICILRGDLKRTDKPLKVGTPKRTITKEELRASECDLDKDVDSQEVGKNREAEDKKVIVDYGTESASGDTQKCKNSHQYQLEKNYNNCSVDVESLRRAYVCLFKCPEKEFSETLMDAIGQLLRDSLSIQLSVNAKNFMSDPSIINVFIILLENPALTSTEYTEGVLGDLCHVMAYFDVEQQAAMVLYLASMWEAMRIHRMVEALHQLITVRLLTSPFSGEFTINEEETITSATKVMKIFFYASIYGGQLDHPLLADLPPPEPVTGSNNQDHILGSSKEWIIRSPPTDPLGEALGVHQLDVRTPLVPLEEFYDDFLSDQLEMDRDFAYYKSGNTQKFSFLNYPFILTAATKALGLYYDNRIRMYTERRMSIYQTVMEGTPANPYLNLHIRRDHIVYDALVELELVALDNPSDLKKQLVIEFDQEQGIDEGGVSKEFFQLIVEQIFNPDFAMFCLNQETQLFWFNPTSFENDGQFTLIGLVLGLALYNNIILDLHFPPVMYKKLCGKPGSFHDLKDWNPTLYRSLQDVLSYEGDDMEDVFLQTFRVGYEDIFGASLYHDLKSDGENIFVNQSNKQEFVDLYADFLLNKSVERQFAAFRRGFAMVTDDSPLQHLFRPEELELMICGSQHYDFPELKNSTEYDGGYTATSSVIIWFWEIVDEMSTDEKKQLLQFTTGSARVPVGGLARLKLIIARNGPDTDRLPTAHTCFNVLLLPEYSSKEKLKDCLLKAIKYAQGFGML